jgi:uncharacterized protein (DUF697 family)
MRVVAARALAFEARDVVRAIRQELSHSGTGEILVGGMLAEQLARELASDAAPGAVTVGNTTRLGRAAVVVHVIAGDPTPDDHEIVRAADKERVPVVLVQLWPQAEWTRPFVLSPFVVECRAGEGFPIREIADRVAEASEEPQSLASRIPALRDAAYDRIVREATVRAALVGAVGGLMGASRPLLTLEQVRMLSRLSPLGPMPIAPDARSLAGVAGPLLAAGFVLREASRRARHSLPAPAVNAVVAAAATFALGALARRLPEL